MIIFLNNITWLSVYVYCCCIFNLIRQRDVHNRVMRNNPFITLRVFHKFAENCIRFQLPLLLNRTPIEILNKTSTHSEFEFKMYAKNYFINNFIIISFLTGKMRTNCLGPIKSFNCTEKNLWKKFV